MDSSEDALIGMAVGCVLSLLVAIIALPLKLLSLIGFKWAFVLFSVCIVLALLLSWIPILHIDPNKVFPNLPIHVDYSTYVITSKIANGRKCPRTTSDCEVVNSFKKGDEIQVLGSLPGEAINGTNTWLLVLYDKSTIYVHSSLASPKTTPVEPPSIISEPEPVTVVPPPSKGVQAPTPYKSQWELYKGSLEKYKGAYAGWNNCGPASVAMVMAYYRKEISVDDAAKRIRNNNDPYINTKTSFRSGDTGNNTKALLNDNGLDIVNVDTFAEMKTQLDRNDPRPVIVLVYRGCINKILHLLKFISSWSIIISLHGYTVHCQDTVHMFDGTKRDSL
jgi:hypothetical protein